MNDKCSYFEPTEIKIREDQPRLRKDMGKIKELAASFGKFGQMQPILLDRNMQLIAGGRRLDACKEAGIKVKAVFTDEVDPIVIREMELEENIQRKALTPAEEIMAVDELHSLKQARYGAAVQGSDKKEGWTQENTAELIGKTRPSVTETLDLAQALKEFPILANCKSKSDIKKAVKGLQRINESIAAVSAYEEMTKGVSEPFELYNMDCIEWLQTLKDKTVDILFTDPPYGIDIHDITIGLGGQTGADITTTGIKYDDSFDNSMELVGKLAVESYRVVKDNGFAVVFCAISNFPVVKTLFDAAGWLCSQRPIIWIKNESGQNNAPSKWMSAGYEAALFARRTDSKLVIEGRVDWVQCPNVLPSMRIHQAEKPVPLIKELLSRLAMPGARVIDPFSGSGATIEAALELKLYPMGCELAVEAYSTAKVRVVNYLKTNGVLKHE
jgi:site-specific DNA-methyltransferase (adenine-specific)